MNLPPLPLKNGVLEIDNSFLEGFTTCPRKSEYLSLRKRIYRGDQPALNFGSAIHAALEYRYKNLKNEVPTIMDNQDIYDAVLWPYFDKNPAPEWDHRTLEFAFELIQQYNAKYSSEPFQLMTNPDGSIFAEMSFSFDFGKIAGVDVFYVGRIDLPVIWDGQIIIIDHKSTSQLGDRYMDGQRVAPQFEGYCWAFQKLTGQTPSGFCINAIRTKEKPMKPRGSWDAWWEEGFQRHKEYLRPGQLEEWHSNTSALIEEFMWHYSRGYMPMKKKACTFYGKCPYYDVCYLPFEQRITQLSSDQYQTNEWSPLK